MPNRNHRRGASRSNSQRVTKQFEIRRYLINAIIDNGLLDDLPEDETAFITYLTDQRMQHIRAAEFMFPQDLPARTCTELVRLSLVIKYKLIDNR